MKRKKRSKKDVVILMCHQKKIFSNGFFLFNLVINLSKKRTKMKDLESFLTLESCKKKITYEEQIRPIDFHPSEQKSKTLP